MLWMTIARFIKEILFMTEIQYPYAYDENNNLVCIKNVTEADRSHEFRCPNCGARMRPRLGMKNAHCFYHADAEICSAESYLHKVAKEIIVRKFNSGSFPIKRKMNLVCNVKCEHGPCQMEEMRDFDLACNYDLPPKVEETQVVDNTRFVPDVTFSSSNEQFNPIYVEIFYKHSCSEKKLELCDNIIEIRVKQFSDLIRLENAVLCEEMYYDGPSTYKAKFINFDSQIYVNPEELRSSNPYCFRAASTNDEKAEDVAKRKKYGTLENDTISRVSWFKGGKAPYDEIPATERYKHREGSLFELTMKHEDNNFDDWTYLLDRGMDLFPEFRRCTVCGKYLLKCDKCKNGSFGNMEMAINCKDYSNRHASGPEVYLWRRGWPDNITETYPARKEEDNKLF